MSLWEAFSRLHGGRRFSWRGRKTISLGGAGTRTFGAYGQIFPGPSNASFLAQPLGEILV
jgi:hypothetical protein